MPIDPNIALGVKPIQFESPINQMAKMYELQNAAQSNKLNQMKMDEYTRGVAEAEQFKNALRNLNRTSPTYAQDEEAVYAIKGIEGLKALESQRKERALTSESQFKAMASKQDFDNQARRDLSFNSSDENVKAYAQDAVLKGVYTQEEADRAAAQLLAIPVEQRKAFLSSQGAKASDLMTKPSSLAALQNELAALSSNDPKRKDYINAIRKETLSADMQAYETAKAEGYKGSLFDYKRDLAKAGSSTSTVVLPAQEKEFEKALGKGQADKVLASKASAEDAAQILATNQVAKNLLDKGMLTGVGAEFFTTLNQGLSQAGIDFGKANAAQNSQAFGALMAKNTATIIKNFGAGTGISDADRIYAKQAAAGDITMDENAIREIIKVNDRVARAAIAKHNKNVSGIKTNIPLSVDVRDYTAGIPEGRSSTGAAKKGRDTLTNIMGF